MVLLSQIWYIATSDRWWHRGDFLKSPFSLRLYIKESRKNRPTRSGHTGGKKTREANLRWKDTTEAGPKEDNITNRSAWRNKIIIYTGHPRWRDKPGTKKKEELGPRHWFCDLILRSIREFPGTHHSPREAVVPWQTKLRVDIPQVPWEVVCCSPLDREARWQVTNVFALVHSEITIITVAPRHGLYVRMHSVEYLIDLCLVVLPNLFVVCCELSK